MSDYYDRTTGEEITDHEAHEMFDAYLDEVLEEVKIGTLSYLPSRVLKEVDPIAYRCEFSDWTSTEDSELVESGYWVRVLTEDGELYDGEPKWYADEDDAREEFDSVADALGDDDDVHGVTVQMYDTSDAVVAETQIPR